MSLFKKAPIEESPNKRIVYDATYYQKRKAKREQAIEDRINREAGARVSEFLSLLSDPEKLKVFCKKTGLKAPSPSKKKAKV